MFRRRERRPPPPRDGPDPAELVQRYLRGQNLEQMHRTDEAIVHYEQAVDGGFDSAGPYDRLIAIYREREQNADVIRVADAALTFVRTYDQKRGWYEQMRTNAIARMKDHPDPKGAEF
jgi:hypothetical protein